MLAMGRALIGNPRVMLLDEPSAALSPKLMAEIFVTVRDIAASGVAILLAEQNASQVLEMSDRALVLISGEVAFEGSGSEIRDSAEVKARVLGTATAGR